MSIWVLAAPLIIQLPNSGLWKRRKAQGLSNLYLHQTLRSSLLLATWGVKLDRRCFTLYLSFSIYLIFHWGKKYFNSVGYRRRDLPSAVILPGQYKARKQEFFLPHGCRVSRSWSILYHFSTPQAGNCMGIWAARLTLAHMVSQQMQGKNLITRLLRWTKAQ